MIIFVLRMHVKHTKSLFFCFAHVYCFISFCDLLSAKSNEKYVQIS
jgi:hypothetical protein